MNLSPFVISQIRTYTPIAVGTLLTWLATSLHIAVDPNSEPGLVALAVGVLSAVYYGLVHLVEQKFPKAGVLLGVAKLPVYTVPAPAGPSIAEGILTGLVPPVSADVPLLAPAAPVGVPDPGAAPTPGTTPATTA